MKFTITLRPIGLALFLIIIPVYTSLGSFALAYGASNDPIIFPLRSIVGDQATNILHAVAAGVGLIGLAMYFLKKEAALLCHSR